MKRTAQLVLIGSIMVGTTALAAGASTTTPVSQSHPCANGGTRSMTGTIDSSQKPKYIYNVTITTNNCVGPEGDTHNGTITVNGVFDETTTPYELSETMVFNDGWTNSNDNVQRACTWNRSGTYDLTTNHFKGTITKSSCSLTVDNKEPEGLLNFISKQAQKSE
ncbi:MAG TPA: hypothetical protein VMH83_16135 [Candidatus Acidoferrum sp.]|nr:hypothetical protein [Candidatus Acidoferrum sp.]